MVTDDDRKILQNFVRRVWYWLRGCYLGEESMPGDMPWPIIPVDKELRDYAAKAWYEFEKEYPPDRLVAPISEAKDEVLISHGLYGAQLHYKLLLVKRAADKARSGNRPGLKRRFIDLVDNVIDSLGPTGLAGGLKELKDALVGSLPESE